MKLRKSLLLALCSIFISQAVFGKTASSKTRPLVTSENNLQVIMNFVDWHNSVFAMKDRKKITLEDLSKLFNKDCLFKVNNYSVASDVNGMLQNYENILKKGHKLVHIDTPFYGTYKTEGGYLVFHTLELVDKEGTSTSNHAASFFRIVNGKISEYIEVYAAGKPKK